MRSPPDWIGGLPAAGRGRALARMLANIFLMIILTKRNNRQGKTNSTKNVRIMPGEKRGRAARSTAPGNCRYFFFLGALGFWYVVEMLCPKVASISFDACAHWPVGASSRYF